MPSGGAQFNAVCLGWARPPQAKKQLRNSGSFESQESTQLSELIGNGDKARLDVGNASSGIQSRGKVVVAVREEIPNRNL